MEKKYVGRVVSLGDDSVVYMDDVLYPLNKKLSQKII